MLLVTIVLFLAFAIAAFYLLRPVPRVLQTVPTANGFEEDDLEDVPLPDDSGLDQALIKSILSSFAKATFHDPPLKYLPEDSIRELISQDVIENELHKANFQSEGEKSRFNYVYRTRLATWICSQAPKVFAVTVQCDLEAYHLLLAMALFRQHGFNDQRFLKAKSPPSEAFPLSIWVPLKLENFHDKQWLVRATVFTPQRYDYDLPAESIFPFMSHGAVPKDGAFSSVYRIEIHRAHNKHPHLKNVALKELKVPKVPQDDEQREINQAWDHEAGALEAINKLNHTHIVQCIAAIRRGNNRYFMFPWADGDSLRDFWDKTRHQGPNEDIIIQAIVQLRGIADALDQLHNFDGGRSVRDKEAGSITIQVNRPTEHDADDQNHGPENIQVTLDNEVDDYRNAESADSIRHGDLKPENILRFLDEGSKLGNLKIADMGLAKRHVVATQLRSKGTTTRYSTRRYEAPETVTKEYPRSRLYDIWSMGCITLEFIVWILYGNDELKNLYNQIEANAQQICQYYEVVTPSEDDPGGARIHPVVLRWMKFIQDKDPECANSTTSAIRELLKAVREKLLIVPLPPDRVSGVERGHTLQAPSLGQTKTLYRATAAQFREALDDILSKRTQPGYMFTGKERNGVKPPSPTSSLLSPNVVGRGVGVSFALPDANGSAHILSEGKAANRSVITDYTLPPRQGWEFHIDNAFAGQLAAEVGSDALAPRSRASSQLCQVCDSFNFWKGGFSIEEKVSELRDRATSCHFCKMLHDIFHTADEPKGDKAWFVRYESNMLLTGGKFPVLSIIRTSELNTQLPIQLGFPELPEVGSKTFFGIIRLWLKDCDASHADCKGTSHRLPTRLIDVGSSEVPVLRLVDTRLEQPLNKKYIALSHPWGDTELFPPFRTLCGNEAAFRNAIPEQELPKTFKDAVICTRELGVRYLWIDSLCIVQGDGGDFKQESKMMEDVFSGAYCVLAASRASNQRDGFLRSRPQREYVTFQRDDEAPFYVCETIDNFTTDVIEGALNKRGWVLQERVLARRTVYFTERQNYFECGSGVRCETLTKMRNNMAEYLGDPDFPTKIVKANRAGKITSFQNLFCQYSRLDFTRDEDRPFAIRGLESRLQRALRTKGAYGLFDDGDQPDGGLFHRSLLWQRGEKPGDAEFLMPIRFEPAMHERVPSWSWMAYKGGIDYTDPPFRSAVWETRELTPPWTRGGVRHTDTGPADGEVALLATVRSFAVAGRLQNEVKLSYDTGRTSASDGQPAQCVVVARAKEGRTDRERRHYVLLVTPKKLTAGRGEKVYERVGAGFMLGKYISLDRDGVLAKIV